MNQTPTRPRIGGEREGEIFAAVVRLLVEVGYDKLTFDAVASAAKASKATLYRRWPSKAELVIAAIVGTDAGVYDCTRDTGTLREDLLERACAPGGLTDDSVDVLGALIPALHRDPELFAAFQAGFIQPKLDAAIAVFERAKMRGEVGPKANSRLLALVLPSMCVHETFVNGIPSTPERIAEIVDVIVLPACRASLQES